MILILRIGLGHAREQNKSHYKQLVILREEFDGLDKKMWSVGGGGWTGATCSEGILQVKTSGGSSNAISISSRDYYLYGSMETRVRFSRLGEGFYYYFGFMSREPWAHHTAWLMGCETNNVPLRVLNDEVCSKTEYVNTDTLNENQWYTFKIEWTPEYVELFVNGKSRGRITDPEAIPEVAVPIVFDVWTKKNEEIVMEVDWVEVEGKRIEPEKVAVVPETIPLPIKAKRRSQPLPEESVQIELTGSKASLENRFFKYDLSFNDGPLITGLVNKFIAQNIIDGHSRLFLVHHKNKAIANDSYQLIKPSVEKSDSSRILHTLWRCTNVPLELELGIRVDTSAEMTWQASIKNIGEQEETFGITCPILEHIKIGKKVT